MNIQIPDNRPLIMGVLNITPDSFSDGGVHFEASVAIQAGLKMFSEGADILDIGGESTRPGSEAVSVGEELRRVLPVLEGLSKSGVLLSIDTSKPEIAAEAVSLGVTILNDVTGGRNQGIFEVAATHNCTLCLMHMKGEPRTMQENPVYENVVQEVKDYLVVQAALAESAGVLKKNIWIDPGIGFGKTLNHNLLLLRHLDALVETGYPVMVGVSRKSFLGKITGNPNPAERENPTLIAQSLAQASGAKIIRTHNVKLAKEAVDVAAAILEAQA